VTTLRSLSYHDCPTCREQTLHNGKGCTRCNKPIAVTPLPASRYNNQSPDRAKKRVKRAQAAMLAARGVR